MTMLTNAQKPDCPRADDIVAYIYNEIDRAAKDSFERHLPECVSCTDEFALVSDARFSVFEWHKEEFLPLATPDLARPFRAEAQKRTDGIASWIEGLRNFGWGAAAMASMVLIVGIAFGMFWLMPADDQIARVETEPASIPMQSPNAEAATDLKTAEAPSADIEPEDLTATREETKVRPAVTRTVKRTSDGKTVRPTRSIRNAVPDKAPMLSNYEETEDRSLRLSDLLNEVGG